MTLPSNGKAVTFQTFNPWKAVCLPATPASVASPASAICNSSRFIFNSCVSTTTYHENHWLRCSRSSSTNLRPFIGLRSVSQRTRLLIGRALPEHEGIQGVSVVFTVGAGTDWIHGISDLCQPVVDTDLAESPTRHSDFTKAIDHHQLRWLHDGVFRMAAGAVLNAMWELWAKQQQKPLLKLLRILILFSLRIALIGVISRRNYP